MSTKRRIAAATVLLALGAAAPAAATEPDNNDFGEATPITGGNKPPKQSYNLTSADLEAGEPASGGVGETAWFKWKPSNSGGAYADVCGAPSNQIVRVYKVKSGQTVQVDHLEYARVGDGDPIPADSFCRFHWRAKNTTTYYIQVDHQGTTKAWDLVIDQDNVAPAMPFIDPEWEPVTGPSYKGYFTGDDDATFLCRLDGGTFEKCTSPHPLTGMTDANHTFSVRAMDAHGNLSSIRSQVWKVDAFGPQTAITSAPGATTITFTTNEPSKAKCSVDGGAAVACASPYAVPALGAGEHTISVRSTDPYGNIGPAAIAKWTVAGPPSSGEQEQQASGGGEQPATTPSGVAATAPTEGGPSGTPLPAGCTVKLSAPKRATRKALRKGLVVKVTASGAGCVTKVVLQQRGRGLAAKRVTLASGGTAKVRIKSKRARRGAIVLSAGGATRRVKVV